MIDHGVGDFNVALNVDDKSVGTSSFDISMREFRECVEDIEVSDVNYTRLKFTWNQKPKGQDGLLKKPKGQDGLLKKPKVHLVELLNRPKWRENANRVYQIQVRVRLGLVFLI